MLNKYGPTNIKRCNDKREASNNNKKYVCSTVVQVNDPSEGTGAGIPETVLHLPGKPKCPDKKVRHMSQHTADIIKQHNSDEQVKSEEH